MGEYEGNIIRYDDIIDEKVVSVDLFNKKIRIENDKYISVNKEELWKSPNTDVLRYLDDIRNSNKNVVFGIVTTYKCNLSCLYCYEKNYQTDNNIISSKVSEDICKYITQYVDFYKIENVKLIFTGGEPTLNMEAILFITKVLSRHFKQQEKGFSFSIVTNGTVNIENYLEELREVGLDLVQISLDGPRKIHNLRRVSNFDAYGASLNFIRCCVKNKIPLVVRTNIDKQNIEHFEEMVREICDLANDGVMLSLYQTEKTICERSINEPFCFDVDNILSAYSIAKKYGFKVNRYNPFWGGCMSLVPIGQFIDPNGNIYKCGGMLGHSNEIVGSIYDFKGVRKNVESYIDKKITEDCIKCNMFPACAGGCIYKKHYTKSCNEMFKLNMYEKIRFGIILHLIDKGIIKSVEI